MLMNGWISATQQKLLNLNGYASSAPEKCKSNYKEPATLKIGHLHTCVCVGESIFCDHI